MQLFPGAVSTNCESSGIDNGLNINCTTTGMMRFHVRNILRKLCINDRRTQAAIRAFTLNLFTEKNLSCCINHVSLIEGKEISLFNCFLFTFP